MLKIGNQEQSDNGKSTILCATEDTSGDTALVAAPGAGKAIVIDWCILQNESATATTIQLKSGSTAKVRYLAQYQGDGLALAYPLKLAANEALNINLSGANSVGYTIAYHIE
jgi:hypothetical protein